MSLFAHTHTHTPDVADSLMASWQVSDDRSRMIRVCDYLVTMASQTSKGYVPNHRAVYQVYTPAFSFEVWLHHDINIIRYNIYWLMTSNKLYTLDWLCLQIIACQCDMKIEQKSCRNWNLNWQELHDMHAYWVSHGISIKITYFLHRKLYQKCHFSFGDIKKKPKNKIKWFWRLLEVSNSKNIHYRDLTYSPAHWPAAKSRLNQSR